MFYLFRKFILVISLLIFIPTVQAKLIDDAIKNYHYGEFKFAQSKFLKLAQQNNPLAYYYLGKMYERGDGVDVDESIALNYYVIAARADVKDVRQRLAQLQGAGDSVVLDWYLESAWDGDVESQYNLGYIYETGLGASIDENRAFQWYREAAHQGHAEAKLRIGFMFYSGAGIDRDVLSGRKWILESAKHENVIAQAIKDLLLDNDAISENSVARVVRGLRTLEHANASIMLRTLTQSLDRVIVKKARVDEKNSLHNQNTVKLTPQSEDRHFNNNVNSNISLESTQQVKSIKMLDEKSELNSKTTDIENNDAANEFEILSINNGNSKSIELWLYFLGVFCLLATVGIVMHYRHVASNRNNGIHFPKFKMGKPITVPELRVETEDLTLLRNLWVNSQEHNVNINLAISGSAIKPNNVDERDIESEDLTSNKKAPPVYFDSVNDVQIETRKSNLLVKDDEKSVSQKALEASHQVDSKAPVVKGPDRIHSQVFSRFNLEKDALNGITKDGLSGNPLMAAQSINKIKAQPSQIDNVKLPKSSSKESLHVGKKQQDKPQSAIASTASLGDSESSFVKSSASVISKEIEASESDDVLVLAETRYNIGLMFAKGEGTPQNINLAIKWLQKSADQGFVKAEYELASLIRRYPNYKHAETRISRSLNENKHISGLAG